MTDLPAGVKFGKVVGKWLLAVGDSDDAGSNPDAQPVEGTVKFVPRPANQRVTDPEVMMVTSRPPICNLNADGVLVDAQNNVGVWLAVGVYDVTFTFKSVQILPITIEVTELHTALAPLDLNMAIPPVGADPLDTTQYSELSDRIDNIVLEAGVTDHGLLTGLFPDDDHPQYHTDARGDARYASLASLAAEQAARESGDAALDTRVDALETAPPPTLDRETLLQMLDPYNPGLPGILVPGNDINFYRMDPPNHGYIIFNVLGLDLIRENADADAAALSAHVADTTDVHGITDTSALVLTSDARLSDARTPTAHTHPVSDMTATGTRDNTTFLRGDNTWAVPAGGGSGGVTDHGALTGLGDDDHTQYALADGSRGSFATTAQGAKADTALQPATGQVINVQTGTSYALVASDAGKLVTLNNAGAISLTVPGSTFTAGQRVDCIVLGAGMVTVSAGSGAPTVVGTPSLVSRSQYSAFSVIALSASSFVVVGDLA